MSEKRRCGGKTCLRALGPAQPGPGPLKAVLESCRPTRLPPRLAPALTVLVENAVPPS